MLDLATILGSSAMNKNNNNNLWSLKDLIHLNPFQTFIQFGLNIPQAFACKEAASNFFQTFTKSNKQGENN